ncbi:MAG: exodeoxyribonuclease V subunit alpha [Rubrivivax sp.]|nr:exodeoxyribonuclease V subunit alpha [Rubrivivax sp.]
MNRSAEAGPVASAPPASPAERLAAGFAAHVGGWARRLGADDRTQRTAGQAAAALSLATSAGHVCLSLQELAGGTAIGMDSATLRATLISAGVVGTPEEPGAMPMILDEEGRLYLHRYFDYERRLAARLVRATSAMSMAPFEVQVEARQLLDELFAGNEAALHGRVDWQKIAAALALRGRLTVISGGPGTGKTTTVVNLLACLVARDPDCRIALAAPTGKAAARMTEAIRQRALHLPEALQARLPIESSTVHRLLGVTPAGGGFVHHAVHPLAIDVLVVDEASMLDLALATRLLEAVPDSARIILLGDKDQLSAVESGAVFAELSADPGLTAACRGTLGALCGLDPGRLDTPEPARQSPLKDAVVWFTQNFRFATDSGIGRLAADINGARAMDAVAWLRSGADGAIRWLDEGGAQPGDAATAQLLHGYAAYLEAVLRDPRDQARITAAFGGFRALCAVREGPRGMLALNERMTRHARDVLAPLEDVSTRDGLSNWFVGRPVMVLRNDHVLKLFNGDIGITLPDQNGTLVVVFPDASGGFRCVAPVRMPEHQTAFAMTVHKAQGSEFDEVLVLLPQQRSPVLTRELLYTAVTRARQRVTLVCSAEVLAATILSPTRRHSGLLARLRDATAAGPPSP